MRSVIAAVASAAALTSVASAAKWSLHDTYSGVDFENKFRYWGDYISNQSDPTNGLVKYVPKATAKAQNFTYVRDDGQFIIRVDTTEVQPEGRPSVRLTSNETYADGVFVLNTTHIPVGCSVWPAFWAVAPATQHYPQGGEIDWLENANNEFNGNLVSLHTADKCDINQSAQNQTGITTYTSCQVNYATGNEGCRVEMNQTRPLGTNSVMPTTGPELNEAQGGLFAMERDLGSNGEGMRVWYFPHDQVPDNLKSGSQEVDSSVWGQPAAHFPVTSCADQFGDLSLVFTITLCGDWAGATYEQSGCTKQFQSCAHQVGQNGSSYKEAYWAVHDVRAFAQPKGTAAWNAERQSNNSGSQSKNPGSQSGNNGNAGAMTHAGNAVLLFGLFSLGASLLL